MWLYFLYCKRPNSVKSIPYFAGLWNCPDKVEQYYPCSKLYGVNYPDTYFYGQSEKFYKGRGQGLSALLSLSKDRAHLTWSSKPRITSFYRCKRNKPWLRLWCPFTLLQTTSMMGGCLAETNLRIPLGPLHILPYIGAKKSESRYQTKLSPYPPIRHDAEQSCGKLASFFIHLRNVYFLPAPTWITNLVFALVNFKVKSAIVVQPLCTI